MTNNEALIEIENYVQERYDFLEEWKGNEFELLRKIAFHAYELGKKVNPTVIINTNETKEGKDEFS